MITALLVAGAGGSAICADLGARNIREEIDAMEVLGVSPIQRLIVPRVLPRCCVSVLLNGLVSVVGVLGGYFFNVIMQGGTPGAYLASFNALAQLPDLVVSEIKAVIFGFVAGVVAAYRGLNPRAGPKGVGDAVNQSVVITFLLLFFVNIVLTALYLQTRPAEGELSDRSPANTGARAFDASADLNPRQQLRSPRALAWSPRRSAATCREVAAAAGRGQLRQRRARGDRRHDRRDGRA